MESSCESERPQPKAAAHEIGLALQSQPSNDGQHMAELDGLTPVHSYGKSSLKSYRVGMSLSRSNPPQRGLQLMVSVTTGIETYLPYKLPFRMLSSCFVLIAQHGNRFPTKDDECRSSLAYHEHHHCIILF